MGDLDALARELVEAGMPWLPGMLMWHGGDRLVLVDSSVPKKPAGYWASDHGVWYEATIEGAPDLADWPTIGALLGELSKRGRPLLCQDVGAMGWACDLIGTDNRHWVRTVRGATPGEAVGRALLAVLRGGS